MNTFIVLLNVIFQATHKHTYTTVSSGSPINLVYILNNGKLIFTCQFMNACFCSDEATTLFRATTLASTLMEQYMKATATQFVLHALKDSILKIMESKQSCEVRNYSLLLLCIHSIN